MIYLDTHTEALDIDRALMDVSPQRREAALRYVKASDRRQSLAAYLLLCRALKEEYGITEPPVFDFGPHGKPFLKDYPSIHFNLSHCPGAALCVIAPAPVGCDIEAVPSRLDWDVCSYACSEAELSVIQADSNPALAFARLWTRKEAFLKYLGEGISANLRDLLSSPDARPAHFITDIIPDQTCVWSVFGDASFTLPKLFTT